MNCDFVVSREEDGGASHSGAEVREGGASKRREAEGRGWEEGGTSHPGAAVWGAGASLRPEAKERGGRGTALATGRRSASRRPEAKVGEEARGAGMRRRVIRSGARWWAPLVTEPRH